MQDKNFAEFMKLVHTVSYDVQMKRYTFADDDLGGFFLRIALTGAGKMFIGDRPMGTVPTTQTVVIIYRNSRDDPRFPAWAITWIYPSRGDKIDINNFVELPKECSIDEMLIHLKAILFDLGPSRNCGIYLADNLGELIERFNEILGYMKIDPDDPLTYTGLSKHEAWGKARFKELIGYNPLGKYPDYNLHLKRGPITRE
jgi:hypothetical protein